MHINNFVSTLGQLFQSAFAVCVNTVLWQTGKAAVTKANG